MKWLIHIIVIFSFLLCCVCYADQLYEVEVVKISDGDSIWIRMQGIKIRVELAGIDTPEEFKIRKLRMDAARCKRAQKHVRKLGRIATRYARRLLHKRDKVSIKVYKRVRNQVWALLYLQDGTCYNEKMVKEGYACVSNDIVEEKELLKLKKLLEEAKQKRKGLWKKYYKRMSCLCKVK